MAKLTLKNPEHIRDVVARVMHKLEQNRRFIIRCHICDKIELVKPGSEEQKEKLCTDCLKAYGHLSKDSDHDA